MIHERGQFDDSLLDDSIETPNESQDDEIHRADEFHREDEEGEETSEDDELDAFSSFLKSKGIKDGKTILFENDEGGTEEVEFSNLTKQEQLEILNSISDPGLTQDEIETINFFRQNNVTLQDVITHYQQKAIDEYIKNNKIEKSYSIDEYNSDELYLADQKAKFPDMTDEERMADLEIAKSNEDLFNKKVEAIRKQYIELEEAQKAEYEKAEKDRQVAYQNLFVDALDKFESISLDYKDPKSDSLIVEQADKNAIYDYFFKQDADGMTAFAADLSNPEILADLAWYRLFGKDAISDISNYWKDELKKARRTEPKTNVTIKKTNNTQTKDEDPKSSFSPIWEKLI